MATAFAENFDHGVGCPVDHCGAIGKAGHAVDEAIQLHHAGHLIEVAQVLFGDGE